MSNFHSMTFKHRYNKIYVSHISLKYQISFRIPTANEALSNIYVYLCVESHPCHLTETIVYTKRL